MKLISVGDLMFEVVVKPQELAMHGDEALADVVIRAGGQALNVARSFQQSGGESELVSSVGGDDWGLWLQQSLARDDIKLIPQATDVDTGIVVSVDTGIVVSIEDEQERTMYSKRGANEALDLTKLPIDDWRPQEVYVYLSGYLLSTLRGRNGMSSVIRKLAEKNIFTAMDTPPAHILKRISQDEVLESISGLSALFTTLEEGQVLTAKSSVEEVAAHLTVDFPTVVVKQGRGGCWVQGGDNGKHVPTQPMEHVDATGAGDAFCGAFLYALSQRMPNAEAGGYANQMAGKVIAKSSS